MNEHVQSLPRAAPSCTNNKERKPGPSGPGLILSVRSDSIGRVGDYFIGMRLGWVAGSSVGTSAWNVPVDALALVETMKISTLRFAAVPPLTLLDVIGRNSPQPTVSMRAPGMPASRSTYSTDAAR